MTNAKTTETTEASPELPSNITWVTTTIVHKGGNPGKPVPEAIVKAVQASYDKFKSQGAENSALASTLESEVLAKKLVAQLRRAARELKLGLSVQIEGTTVTFMAKEPKATSTANTLA